LADPVQSERRADAPWRRVYGRASRR
jgi:hypothetical protein